MKLRTRLFISFLIIILVPVLLSVTLLIGVGVFQASMSISDLTEVIKNLTAEKQNINEYLDILTLWFRDVLLYKATKEIDNLVFKREIMFLSNTGMFRSFPSASATARPPLPSSRPMVMSIFFESSITDLLSAETERFIS